MGCGAEEARSLVPRRVRGERRLKGGEEDEIEISTARGAAHRGDATDGGWVSHAPLEGLHGGEVKVKGR